MYKFDRNHQFTLSDFNQPIGLKMNPENRWVTRAATMQKEFQYENKTINAIS